VRRFISKPLRLKPFVAALSLVLLDVCAGGIVHATSESQRCSAGKIVAMGRCYNCLVKEERRALSGDIADIDRCHEKLVDRFLKIDAAGGCGLAGDAEIAYARIADGLTEIVDSFLAEHSAAPEPAKCAAAQLKAAGTYAKCRAKHRASEVKVARYRNIYTNFSPSEVCFAGLSSRLSRIWDQDGGSACPFPGNEGMDRITSSTILTTSYLPVGDFRDAHFEDVELQTGALAGGDFSDAVLHGTNLDDADLSGSTFVGASLGNFSFNPVSMNRANLSEVDFSSAHFVWITAGALAACPTGLPASWLCASNHILGPRVVARGYDLSGADLEGVDLSTARLGGSNFSGANLQGADFGNALFEDANFSGADLSNATWGSAEIRNANLDGANLSGVDMSGFYEGDYLHYRFSARNLAACPATLQEYFTCTQGTIFGPYAIVDGVDFSGEDFTDGFFTNASLVGTLLVGTNFSLADLTQVDLTGANLTGANLANATISAVWSATICPDGVLSDAVGDTCCGHHVGAPPTYCQ
jgi:uncharacterized protein YjbI with pentapeptide repeats